MVEGFSLAEAVKAQVMVSILAFCDKVLKVTRKRRGIFNIQCNYFVTKVERLRAHGGEGARTSAPSSTNPKARKE